MAAVNRSKKRSRRLLRSGRQIAIRRTRPSGLTTSTKPQALPHLGLVRVTVAGELQQEGQVMTSVSQVKYALIPSQAVACAMPGTLATSVLRYSQNAAPKIGSKTEKPVQILRISFRQNHFLWRQSILIIITMAAPALRLRPARRLAGRYGRPQSTQQIMKKPM